MPSALKLAPAAVDVETRGDDLVLRSPHVPGPAPRALGVLLEGWAQRDPTRIFMAQREGAGWRTLDYGTAWSNVRRIGSALLQRGAGPTRPLALLSDNSIAHAQLQLGAMHVGVPVAPVSPAYSLMSSTLGRLKVVLDTLRPALVFAEDPERYAAALATVPAPGQVLAPLPQLLETEPSDAMEQAWAAVGPDTVAKILFTSGSTGTPKGVVNTQRMLCTNQEAIATLWPFIESTPPITVDWLPWSHTFGGNHNLNMVLRNGGTLYIDGGRPAPGLIEHTAENLRLVSPTVYFNVPRGYDLLATQMERDEALRRSMFARLDLLFYAAAALPPATRKRLEALAAAEQREVFFASAWGSTETAPLATSAYFPTTTPAVIGLPAPGVEIKLAATEGRHELRVRGPNLTPGTWTPGGQLVPAAVDDEGFLHTGDAGRLADPDDPTQGLAFEGRLGENFKLSTGTWVLVGTLRVALVDACAPHVQDAVIAGHDRDQLCALLFVADPGDENARAEQRATIRDALQRFNAASPASSTTIARVSLQFTPPSLDAGETTDKGYINQRRVLENRADTVGSLYREPYGPDVVVVAE
ncbi:MAG: feruloyl-CoA synthase [Myxococcota bacterium]